MLNTYILTLAHKNNGFLELRIPASLFKQYRDHPELLKERISGTPFRTAYINHYKNGIQYSGHSI